MVAAPNHVRLVAGTLALFSRDIDVTQSQLEAYAHACARWMRKHRASEHSVELWLSHRGFDDDDKSRICALMPVAESHQIEWTRKP